MRVKLPENFGTLSVAGEPLELKPDADGCVDVEDGVAQALLSHGGTIAPDVEEANAALDTEVEQVDKQRELLQAKRQRGR